MRRALGGLALLFGLVSCRGDLATRNAGSDRFEADPGEPSSPLADASTPKPVAPNDAGSTIAPKDAGSTVAPDGAAPVAACQGPLAQIHELAEGLVPTKTTLLLEGVATSQKFLVSAGSGENSCWFGAFVAEAGRAGAGSGILLIAAAPPLDGEERCAWGRDALPDDLAPGDVVEAFGTFTAFRPSSCPEIAPQLELVVHDGCPVRRLSRGGDPPVANLDVALADDIARGTEPSLLSAWGGALVRIEHATALRDGQSSDVVGPYGVIRLEQTALEVHDKIFYYDAAEPGAGSPAKAPVFSYPTEFRSITGLIYLDYCTWSLAPRDKCLDFDPPSEDCRRRPEARFRSARQLP